jgi:allophanate hydrolase
VSIFAFCCDDAQRVLDVCAVFDDRDAYARKLPFAPQGFDPSRFRFGVPRPEQLEFFGNEEAEWLFTQAIERLQALGGQKVEVDFAPYLAAARLLYQGPWVAERYAAIEAFIEAKPDSLLDVTRSIITSGRKASAVDSFKAQYRLMELRRQAEAVWPQVDCLLTPTAGTLYRIEEVAAEPVRFNSNLGYYTNFMNLLDLSAVAVPAGFQTDGLPFGVTLFAPAFADRALMALADRLHQVTSESAGATGLPLPPPMTPHPGTGNVPLAVCGAHLSGLPLNHQLTERGAWLLQRTRTFEAYRLYVLPGGPPQRPGLVRDNSGGSIEVEVWAMPSDQVGGFLQQIPAPLGLGQVQLEDGRWVCGFICESYAIEGAEDVTTFGGWRNYLANET